jgi:hypothetical protein
MNFYNENDRPILSAQENADTLDLIGKTLFAFVGHGTPIDSATASVLAILLADCRVYSAIRDQDSLTDENTRSILGVMSEVKTHQQDLSAAADSIIADLRKSGINI